MQRRGGPAARATNSAAGTTNKLGQIMVQRCQHRGARDLRSVRTVGGRHSCANVRQSCASTRSAPRRTAQLRHSPAGMASRVVTAAGGAKRRIRRASGEHPALAGRVSASMLSHSRFVTGKPHLASARRWFQVMPGFDWQLLLSKVRAVFQPGVRCDRWHRPSAVILFSGCEMQTQVLRPLMPGALGGPAVSMEWGPVACLHSRVFCHKLV